MIVFSINIFVEESGRIAYFPIRNAVAEAFEWENESKVEWVRRIVIRRYYINWNEPQTQTNSHMQCYPSNRTAQI